MRTVLEIFRGRFATCLQAAVQRCDATPNNLAGLEQGYAEHWPALRSGTSMIVVAIGDSSRRALWCGRLIDQVPSKTVKGRFRFLVDEFEHVGDHVLATVSDADFYGNSGGGGSRVVVRNPKAKGASETLSASSALGENERREVWVRKNHRQFRDPVYLHWDATCAVLGHSCNNLLVASHIKPWSLSSAREKTDPNNGLLLSVALDKLFDTGLIGFRDDGRIVLSKLLAPQSISALGVSSAMRLRTDKLTARMKKYLRWHRDHFRLA